MTIPVEVAEFLSTMRARRAATQRRNNRKRVFQKVRQAQLSQLRFGDHSRVVRMLADAYRPEVKLNRRDPMIVVPEVFSIIDDPVAALHLLLSFAKVARQNKVRRLKIDQGAMVKFDLAANTVLGIIATELRTEAKQRKTAIFFSGRFPQPLAAQRFVRSVGIVKQLDVANQVVAEHEQKNLRIFDKRNHNYRESEDPTKADFKSRSCTQFVEHFNECLHDPGRELTRESVQQLGAYITEILGNAEDHPGFRDWTVQGYLDNSLDVPTCEIAIVNFGWSIAETMKKAGKYTWDQISRFVLTHRGSKFFGSGWRERDLLTVIALQEHVSSKNRDAMDSRGQGTVEFIEFFQKVCAECSPDSPVKARMAILSGSTHILFDGKYKLQGRGNDQHGKVIAFNASNSLYLKPDPNYVRSLGSLTFPGTIISIRFPLGTRSTVALGEKPNGPFRD